MQPLAHIQVEVLGFRRAARIDDGHAHGPVAKKFLCAGQNVLQRALATAHARDGLDRAVVHETQNRLHIKQIANAGAQARYTAAGGEILERFRGEEGVRILTHRGQFRHDGGQVCALLRHFRGHDDLPTTVHGSALGVPYRDLAIAHQFDSRDG